MLKKLFLIILLTISLCGCRPVEYEENDSFVYDILSVSGSASLSLLGVMKEGADISVTADLTVLEDAFEKGEKQLIIAPLNIGVPACENGNYALLSLVHYCDYKIMSLNEDADSGSIGAYGKESIIAYLLEELSETDYRNFTFVWYDDVNEMIEAFENGEIETLLIGEITGNQLAEEGYVLYEIGDLREDYEYITSLSRLPLEGLFVSKTMMTEHNDSLVSLIRTLKSSISSYKSNKTTFNEALESVDLTILGFEDSGIISESYNYCGLDFVYANSCVDEIEYVLDLCDIALNEAIIVE